MEGLKDTANTSAIDTKIYRDRVGAPLAMFGADMNEDDRNNLSTDGSPRTDINITAATADTLIGTRVNTTRETTRQLQKKTKHKQAMDKKEKADNGHLLRYFDSTDPILGISKHDMVSIN